MFCFASFALLHLFFTSNRCVVFVDEGRKNISCPRAQGTVATALLTPPRPLNVEI